MENTTLVGQAMRFMLSPDVFKTFTSRFGRVDLVAGRLCSSQPCFYAVGEHHLDPATLSRMH